MTEVVRIIEEVVAVVRIVSEGPQGGGGVGGGGLVMTIPLNAVSSYTANHSFPYRPRVWIVDADGREVETDVSHPAGQVYLTFASPFTGTLYLA